MKATVTELAQKITTKRACTVLGYPRSSYYRSSQKKPVDRQKRTQAESPRALPSSERDIVEDTLNSERFVDCSPQQVYGVLLDEGTYFCSISTMYRILQANDEVRERRNQKRHPAYKKPELVAAASNQVWGPFHPTDGRWQSRRRRNTYSLTAKYRNDHQHSGRDCRFTQYRWRISAARICHQGIYTKRFLGRK